MLRLLSLLQTHRFWPGPELADRLDVSPRTLRRDVDRLRELGYPVDAQRGAEGGYQLAPGAALPPLVLDDDEAVALTVGLLSSATSAIGGTAEAAARALAKIVQVMPKRLRRRVEAVRAMTEPLGWSGPPPAAVDPDVLTAVAQACRDSVRLDFAYSAADGTASQRRAEPHRLVSVGRRWYVVAYDLTRHDWRSFRLDRMSRPRPGAPFAPRRLPADDAAEFVRAGLARAPQTHTVQATIAASADAVRKRIGRWAEVTADGEDRCSVTIRADSLEWPMLALVSTGADFQVSGSAEFGDYLRGLAARFERAIS
jgi:predicted DNA-binding transcriptional regulator YafY